MTITKEQSDVIHAVLYAVKQGCFHPVPQPRAGASLRALIKWGAMHNLHRAIASLGRAGQADRAMYQL